MLVQPCEVIEDEVGVGLDPKHAVKLLLTEILDDDEELIAEVDLLLACFLKINVNGFSRGHSSLLDGLVHNIRPATYLNNNLNLHQLSQVPCFFGLDLGRIVDRQPLQLQLLLVDEVLIGDVVH